jgi:hypothetical protein
VHFENGTPGLSAAHLVWVSLARQVTVGVFTSHWLVIRGAVTIAASLKAKIDHIWNSPAEIKAPVDGHFLPVFLGYDLGVVDNRHVGSAFEFVPVLAIPKLVTVLQHSILDARSQQEAIFRHHLEGFNGIRVHTGTRKTHLGLLQRVRALLDQTGFGKTRMDRTMFPAFTSVVTLMVVLVLVASMVVFMSMLSFPLAHAHALVLMWLNLLVFFG